MSFKPAVKTAGSEPWGYNALVFATKEEAEAWALDLMLRWTAVSDYAAHESGEEVTHVIKDGVVSEVGYVEVKP